MLQRSIAEAEVLAGRVRCAELFDTRPLRMLWLVAGSLLLSVLIPLVIQPQLAVRWWNAFVLCRDVYRVRTTDIVATVIAQPGDRRVEFSAESLQPVYRHPRSADLELEFSVPPDGPQAWRVPDRIRVDVLRADGSRSRAWVSKSSPRTYRFVITQLREPVELEVLAGDFRSRVPWRVDVVDTPGLDAIQLKCVYPEYTGWNQSRESTLVVTGSEIPLPEGTRFYLTAVAAKSLQSARIVTERFEVFGYRQQTLVRLTDGTPLQSLSRPLVAADGRSLSVGFMLAGNGPGDGTESVRGAATAEASAAAAVETQETASGGGSVEGVLTADGDLRITSNTSLRFFLHDIDNVMSASPETLRVAGIPDAPPVVVAQMTGIGNSVTRRARIPVAGRVRDDYGLQSVGFEFQVDDETGWRPRPLRAAVAVGSTEVTLQRDEAEPFEYFEVQPLELSEGQSLTLTVIAADGNPEPGPGISRSAHLPFRIVSDDELL